MTKMLRFLLLLCLIYESAGREGFGPTDQEWGYSTVRPDSYMFWWLHFTTADVSNPTERPLIIWLQGGPGSSSTGYGNFAELGPLDLELKPRNTTWVQWANVLFVDNPVGTGFGYIGENGSFALNNTQIAQDFLVFMKDFYQKLPQFENIPLYIFCESYGGKMTPEIALFIYKAQKNGEIPSNLKGVGLGDGWVSPIDSVLTWAPYLLNLGLVDQDGYESIMKQAYKARDAIDREDYEQAFNLWGLIEEVVEKQTYNIDFYNVLLKPTAPIKKIGLYRSYLGDALSDIMNDLVAPALGLTHKWDDVDGGVFNALGPDFMRPVIHLVDELLDTTDLTVAVYNGQLDLIVDTPGTVNWIKEMKFKDKKLWEHAERLPFHINGFMEGYVKKYDKFAFYWVNNAGHMVPADNPSGMEYILREVTNNFEV
ncbi:retinoid-inducible serine carboxypeptidase-like [Diorhabda sublineata]|uniref:retinoid-inducible serine carboxypeptidase-like n=1 Tax=Diorhabda sublineata TaxID=1163346 RepID=UPI0024E13B24|nr:retinoid-inducible serine carboxypeptidase-like [Diorhabda sublineata]